jgi:hypothetical protein
MSQKIDLQARTSQEEGSDREIGFGGKLSHVQAVYSGFGINQRLDLTIQLYLF